MLRVKEQGGLGLHDGSKRVTLNEEGAQRDVGQLFLGLSGTGKSTLTSHGLWLEEPEGVEMIQDDVCALLSSGTIAGSEGGELYIKTAALIATSSQNSTVRRPMRVQSWKMWPSMTTAPSTSTSHATVATLEPSSGVTISKPLWTTSTSKASSKCFSSHTTL
mgnify:CR=1 FL=1